MTDPSRLPSRRFNEKEVAQIIKHAPVLDRPAERESLGQGG
jgi:hypothetical protein